MQNIQLMDTKTAAKVLRFPHHRLLRMLRHHQIFHGTGELKNTPRTTYIDRGFFTTVLGIYKRHGIDAFYTKALVTPTGLSFLMEFIDGMEARTRPIYQQTNSVGNREQHRPSSQQGAQSARHDVLRLAGAAQA